MRMIRGGFDHDDPTVHVSAWSPFDDPTAGVCSHVPASAASAGDGAVLDDATLAAALQLCLGRAERPQEDPAAPLVDACASDEFRVYEFKVRPCGRGRNHDWTECPFAHPGEKARRRDPRAHRYSGVPCPAFRKAGGCKRGDACEFAHGVFECWLHPDRYRTQPCKDGIACRRRVCFFAHTPEQLRVVLLQKQSSSSSAAAAVGSYDGCPSLRQQPMAFSKDLVASPISILISPPKSPLSESPPISPDSEKLRLASWQADSPANDIVASLRQLQLGRAKSMGSSYGRLQMGSSEFASPRGALSGFKAGFFSLPSTPTATATVWVKDETAAARVESGRALRARMFEKLSKDSVFEKAAAAARGEAEPDVQWVSNLIE